MQRYHARDLALMPKNLLWELPEEDLTIIFDDGEVVSNQPTAIFSAYMWGLYAQLPHTPAVKAHFIADARLSTDTHLKLINRVMWAAYDAYSAMGEELNIEQLSKRALMAVNDYYNDLTEGTEEYATTLSMLDIMEVMAHPEIMDVNQNVSSSDKSIVHAHRTIERILKDPNQLTTNILARSVRSGLVKLGQVLQCIGPRGSVTDIDSNIFPYPTLSGFAGGLYRFHDSFIESRTAAKSLTFTEKPLQDTEYFNRRLQLLAASIRDIYDGDCGTTEYLSWHMSAGDLAAFAGKYYLLEDGNGALGIIDDNEYCRKNLVGRTLKIRSVLYCDSPDAGYVCATCYGEMQRSIPYGTNIGHVAATSVCKQASQQVLSVKHLDTSASSGGLRLSDYEQRYVRLGNDPNLMFLAHRLDGAKVMLYVRGDEAQRLSEVKSVENIEVLLPTHISSLSQVGFKVQSKNKEEADLVQVSNGSRTSSLSREMLAYLRAHSWKLTPEGDIEIDLTHWDVDHPLFSTPRRQENMLDYMATIEKFLKAVKRGGAVKSLKDYDTAADALRGFYELVSSRLFVNIIHQEILVKVCMVRSSRHRDYRVPLRGNQLEFGKFDFNIFNRSMGPAMAYQNHKQQWNNPATYLTMKRPPHPLDQILLPRPQK
ncbi:hypothetical protein [Xanthomonas phage RTH11]|nr:hypothetical protein [Xanthomonas phage RTH11]